MTTKIFEIDGLPNSKVWDSFSAQELRLKVMGKNGTLVAENGRVNLGNEH